ncbi:MAG: cysteine desulfurase family protein [Eubacteriales bacterium]|nr:cysteine desulfurase family protein [Eubacteriales bacterium]
MSLIYLDHCATTLPDEITLTYYLEQLREHSGNPASLHRLGQLAAASIMSSNKQMASLIGCQPNEIIWTSGGSESINLALKGYVAANPKRGRTIITAAGEHRATQETLAALTREGYCVVTIPIDRTGQLDLDTLEKVLDDNTILMTFLAVNNETGAILPIEKIVEIKNRKRPLAAIHLDAVQAFGKIPLQFSSTGVDFISGSGHKFGTPKGIGFLIKKQKIRLTPLIHGGGQQSGLRSGTENAPLVATAVFALNRANQNILQKINHCQNLREHLLSDLQQSQTEYVIISPPAGAPQILNLAFPGLRGETLQHALERSDVMISTGSACSSRHKGPSDVLMAMGMTKAVAECSIRISLDDNNTQAEMIATARAIHDACTKYRRSPKS